MTQFSKQTKTMFGQSRQPSKKQNARFSDNESKSAVGKATPQNTQSKSFDDEEQEA